MFSKPLALIGFWGSGKTAVGKLLARELDWPFCDLDERVEQLSGLRLSDAYRQLGLGGLRSVESLALSSLAPGGGVVATSSGCVMMPSARRILSNSFCTVFLDAPFDYLYPRFAGTARPGVDSLSRLELEKLYEFRRPQYLQCADCVADATLPPEQILSGIFDAVL